MLSSDLRKFNLENKNPIKLLFVDKVTTKFLPSNYFAFLLAETLYKTCRSEVYKSYLRISVSGVVTVQILLCM